MAPRGLLIALLIGSGCGGGAKPSPECPSGFAFLPPIATLPTQAVPMVLAQESAVIDLASPLADCGVPLAVRWVRVTAVDEADVPVPVEVDPPSVRDGATLVSVRWPGAPTGAYRLTVSFEPSLGVIQLVMPVLSVARNAQPISVPLGSCRSSLTRTAAGTLLCSEAGLSTRVYPAEGPEHSLPVREWKVSGPVLWGVTQADGGEADRLVRYEETATGFTSTASALVAPGTFGEARADSVAWGDTVYRYTGMATLTGEQLRVGFTGERPLLLLEENGRVLNLVNHTVCEVDGLFCEPLTAAVIGVSSRVLATAQPMFVHSEQAVHVVEARGRPLPGSFNAATFLGLTTEFGLDEVRANEVPLLRRSDGRVVMFTGSPGQDWLLALPPGASVKYRSDDGVVYWDPTGWYFLPVR